jgi:hypothetical protein
MSTEPETHPSFSGTETAARAFDGARFDHLWSLLTDELRGQIVTKARWERLTRAAVIRNWWPELWAEIATPD